jgi:hypothetical protein
MSWYLPSIDLDNPLQNDTIIGVEHLKIHNEKVNQDQLQDLKNEIGTLVPIQQVMG